MADFNITSGYDGLNLPFSPEAEQAVLGAIIIDSDACMSKVVSILNKPDYFYVATHRVIYSAMMTMFNLSQDIDFVTLLETLKRDKEFDETTGKTYLMDLAEIAPLFPMWKFMRL